MSHKRIFHNFGTQKILSNKKFLDRGWPSRVLTSGFDGLVSLANDEWKAHRTLVSPSYAPNVIENFVPTLLEHIELILDDLGDTNEDIVEPLDILQRRILSVVLETSMGLKDEVADTDRLELLEAIESFLNSQFDRILRAYTWNDTTNKLYNWIYGIKDQREKLRNYGYRIIRSRLEKKLKHTQISSKHAHDNPTNKRNQAFLDHMLGTFMNETSAKNQKIDEKGIMNELINIMMTSYETIINTTLWFLYNMACNPQIQEKLYEELLDFNEKNECMTISHINELTFLDQCVKENLRTHPPVSMMVRKIDSDLELDCYLIPKGTLTVTSIHSVHHDEKIYACPEKFDPSRFEPENFAKIPAGAYIPFGDGPRRCIGEKLALFEAKIIFSNIIKKFRVIPVEPEKVKIQIDLLTRPTEPLRFRFIRRDKN